MAGHRRIAQRRIETGDPHDCTDAADQLSILRAVCDTLVRREGALHVPHLATGWQVEPGAREWRFDLRPGVSFHDGTPVDAAAVARSLRRMARADKGYTLGAPGVWRQYLGGAVITPVAERTLRIELPEPVADLLDILEQAFVVSPVVLEAWDSGQASEIIGSGPYRITARTQAELTAMRVPGHFAPAGPEALTWRAEPDAGRRWRMLCDGVVDVAADVPPGPEQPGILRQDYLSPVAIIMLLNAAKCPLADPRVRRALSLGVDRGAMVRDVMGGRAAPLYGFVSPVHFGAGAGLVPFDPEAARRLLHEAGHGAGLTLGVDCPTRLPDEAEALCAALAGQLAPLGIVLDIHIHRAREDYAHMVRRKDIRDMCVFDSSPMSTFRVLYEKIDARVAGSWWQGYHNRGVETLLDAARVETGQEARARLYQQAYAALQDDPPWLTLYNHTRSVGLAGTVGTQMPVDGVLDAACPSPR